ncbi:DUF5799 family protein [Halovivax limisalsi]|uniref:DUF5799 family protein n=1 Tax=Halovivax limisalsi TaxID=1453760 RepID=UPI001FFD3411|nr:DUF5799 family protein [Halovivax limisalsi]
MTETSWTDQIVGERMAVDREFADQVAQSQFSNQEWSLVMTATTFEITDPADPDAATLVANTEQVEHVLPEFENLEAGVAGMGGQPAAGSSGGGLLDSLKSAIGLGGDEDVSEADLEAADALAQEYASELQDRLEETGRWGEVRELAAADADRS